MPFYPKEKCIKPKLSEDYPLYGYGCDADKNNPRCCDIQLKKVKQKARDSPFPLS